MKVLALASHPIEAAATRYRLHQFVQPLAERGIELTILPFLDSKSFASLYRSNAAPLTALRLLKASLGRVGDVFAARKHDVILVQREAMIFGPPLVEWLSMRLGGCPMVLDLDDATYVPYTSPTYGTVGKNLKWFGKTDDLIRWSSVVTCGNRAIAEYVSSKGAKAAIIPTVVDTKAFRPASRRTNEKAVLGWVGTHSTFPYLESIFPVLQELGRSYSFRLKIVGSGKNEVTIPGVEVENIEWRLDSEISHFQSFDIGLYPIVPGLYAEKWEAGKSGFKAIQYMAVGIPYVATPVGSLTEIGEHGTTHFCASKDIEWRDALVKLISDQETREKMGAAGRSHVLKHFALEDQADKLAAVLREAASESQTIL